MTDDELIAKLKASVEPPKEADDPRFWQSFAADLDRAIAPRPRRRWPALAAIGAVAAAAVLAVTLRTKPPQRMAIMQDELTLDADGNSDAAELVGELDLEELHAVAGKF
jgi:hypothetical protein